MESYFVVLIILIISLILLLLYWYKQSFNPYEPNKGLKFKLPPKELYPFKHRWMSYNKDNKEYKMTEINNPNDTNLPCIHYIDESSEKQTKENNICFLLCHGNPTWSFLYRKIIMKLSKKYRCVSIDCPGFGLSTAPKNYSFTTKEQSMIILNVVKKLSLNNIILVQQDWGGPTGFNFAINTTSTIKGFIIGNTWCWRINKFYRFDVYLFSCVFGGFFGHSLGFGYNFVIRNFFREGFYKKLNKDILFWYEIPFKNKNSRHGTWTWPAQIFDANELLKNIELKIPQKFGKKVPCLLTWGTKDLAFKNRELNKFKNIFIDHKVIKLNESSHFWQEDQGDFAADHILTWVKEKF